MTTQLTREELKTMTPDQIVEADAQGRTLRVCGASEERITAHELARDPNARLTPADVALMARHGQQEAVVVAYTEGRVDFTPEETL